MPPTGSVAAKCYRGENETTPQVIEILTVKGVETYRLAQEARRPAISAYPDYARMVALSQNKDSHVGC